MGSCWQFGFNFETGESSTMWYWFELSLLKNTKFKCHLGMSTHIQKENEKQDNSDNVILIWDIETQRMRNQINKKLSLL